MEDLMIVKTSLGDLKHRATRLAAAAESLAVLFEQEATRLKRQEEVARLKAMRSFILERVERERERETYGSIGSSLADGAFSLVRLVAGLVTMKSTDPTVQAISQQLLTEPSTRETPFGTVLVRIGPGGVPNDVEVVNISEMARELDRDERAVVEGLMMQGNLLCGQEAFAGLVDRLADGVLKGELSLPVSPQRVNQLQKRRPLELNPGNVT